MSCCTFVPRKANKKAGLERIMLSTAQKNKWEGNLLRYWFYAKIGFPDPEGSEEQKYLLALGIEGFDHTYQPSFNKRSSNFKSCMAAFKVACQICTGRDVVEEFLAARVWPLSAGWAPLRLERKQFAALGYEVLFPFSGFRVLKVSVMR